MNTALTGMLITMGAYLFGMIIIGAFCSKNENAGDFYLGGRKLGPFVTAMSAEASDMSSWLLMGLPGVAYLSGIADAAWTAIGLAVGTYINWLIVAKRIRLYTVKANNSITIPDFFTNRYRDQDKKKILMLIAAVVIIIFFIPYTASGFSACGKLFATLFGVNYQVAMVISAIVIVLYTCTGGFSAASHTDFVQSIVMSVALIIVVVFGVNVAGGLDAVAANASELPGYLSLTSMYDVASGTATKYGFITILSTMAWGLGYFGMPHILLRFMAIEDENKLPMARRVGSIWVVISMAVAIFIGVVGLSASKAGAVPVLEGSASETIIVELASLLSKNGLLFACMAGIILAGILASTMSTADSQLLAASSSVSENILKGFFNIKLSDKMTVFVARACLVAISVIGVFMAADPNSSVFGIVSFAWAGFGAAFGPVVLTALFWKRSNMYGALAGMVVGGSTVFIWKYLVRPMGGVWNIYELLPAFLLALAAIFVVSLLTPASSKEIQDEFEEVKAACK